MADAGKSLLEGNLRPELRNSEGKRLLDTMTVLGHPVNAQYRNFVERSINVVKRWVREICGITSTVLGLTDWEYIFEKNIRT